MIYYFHVKKRLFSVTFIHNIMINREAYIVYVCVILFLTVIIYILGECGIGILT